MKRRTLKERQEDWDREYDSDLSMHKSRPARPSEELDNLIEEGNSPKKEYREKMQEAKIMQHLIALEELGITCYNAEGNPMIQRCMAGNISTVDRLQDEQHKYNILSEMLTKMAINKIEDNENS